MKTVRVALLLALASACASSPTTPDQAGPVRLTAQIDRGQISSGQTAVATFRIDNTSSQSVSLSFGSGCQVLKFIARRPSDEIVYPSGGGWACIATPTQLTLLPRSSTVQQLKVVTGSTLPDHITLGAGEYAIYATLDDLVYKLKSGQVTLAVQ